jgi:hypothetical protein
MACEAALFAANTSRISGKAGIIIKVEIGPKALAAAMSSNSAAPGSTGSGRAVLEADWGAFTR